MLSKLTQLKQNDFIRNNAVFFGGSLAVAVVNYMYYPVVGRLLGTAEFGEVQALLSIAIQIGLLFTIMADVTINVVANSEDNSFSSRTVAEIERLAVLIVSVLVLFALIFIEPIKSMFKFDEVLPFTLLGLIVIVGASTSMRSAYLRGKLAFGTLSAINMLNAVSKLLASLALVLLGFGTSGAIGGLLIASLLALIFTRRASFKKGMEKNLSDKWVRLPDMRLIKPQLPYAGLVLVVSLVTTVLFSIDVILAKYYFNAQEAGEYAGIATIGRIIYYLTGSVAAVLLASVRIEGKTGANRKLLLRSLSLTAFLGGGALVAFSVAPDFFISTLIGSKYLALASLLPKLSLALFLISIINLLFTYDIALRRWSIAWISFIGALFTFLIMSINHGTPSAMVDSLLYGASALLIMRLLDAVRRSLLLRKA